MTTRVSSNLTHHGQNRDQKTGAPVRGRKSDEIVLLLRNVALAAAESPRVQATRSAVRYEPGPRRHTILNTATPVSSPQDSSASIPDNGNMGCLSHSNVRLLLPRLAEGRRYLERHLRKAVYPPALGSGKIFSVQGKAAPQSGNHARPDQAGLTVLCVEGRWGGGNGVAAGLCARVCVGSGRVTTYGRSSR